MPTQKNPLDTKHSLQILQMEPKGIPSNSSNQQLVSGDESDGYPSDSSPSPRLQRVVSRTEWVTVAILCFVNLINYMDRFTVAGVLEDIQKDFNVGDDKGGLLQTAFVISYMIFAPLFGYLGDRYSRRAIMAFGVFLWGLTTLLGSFMQSYYWFLLMRALVGIGEASYSTIAPTIISDLFINDMRSKMLALFYFAIPVGSGLGYIVGSETASLGGSWHWGLRVTPVLGLIAVILIVFVMHDPERGEAEGHTQLHHTDYATDIKDLVSNRSFMWSTMGFTCVAFVAGALSWWGPIFILNGMQLQPGMENTTLSDVSFKFGVITMVSGIVGVPLGATLAQRLRVNYPRADPLICATGLLISAPLLFAASLFAASNTILCFTLVFLGEVALNLNWSIVADILLYVVVPTRRSTAEAFQILLSHALGDAGSPYLVGVISEHLKGVLSSPSNQLAINVGLNGTASTLSADVDPHVKFHSLQYALFSTNFVEIIGGLFFLLTALYIVADKREADRAATGSRKNWWELGPPQTLYTQKYQPGQEHHQLAEEPSMEPLMRPKFGRKRSAQGEATWSLVQDTNEKAPGSDRDEKAEKPGHGLLTDFEINARIIDLRSTRFVDKFTGNQEDARQGYILIGQSIPGLEGSPEDLGSFVERRWTELNRRQKAVVLTGKCDSFPFFDLMSAALNRVEIFRQSLEDEEVEQRELQNTLANLEGIPPHKRIKLIGSMRDDKIHQAKREMEKIKKKLSISLQQIDAAQRLAEIDLI